MLWCIWWEYPIEFMNFSYLFLVCSMLYADFICSNAHNRCGKRNQNYNEAVNPFLSKAFFFYFVNVKVDFGLKGYIAVLLAIWEISFWQRTEFTLFKWFKFIWTLLMFKINDRISTAFSIEQWIVWNSICRQLFFIPLIRELISIPIVNMIPRESSTLNKDKQK